MTTTNQARIYCGTYAKYNAGSIKGDWLNLADYRDRDEFRDAYAGTADSEADFAQRTAEDCDQIPKDMPSWIVIDWQASWDSGLRFDYFSGQGEDGEMHFFRNE